MNDSIQPSPLVSVITPSFQQGAFIERTLDSVELQRTGALAGAIEHIVMDGGSVDETLGILARREGRLTFRSGRDDGQTAAINAGMAAAKGSILGYLNSDDVYRGGAIAHVLDAFAAHPEADAIYGDAECIDEDDRVIGRYPTEPWSVNRLKMVCFLCQPAVFFRRSFLERFGAFDPRFDHCMDYELWLRSALRGARFVHLPRILAASRLHPATKTLSRPRLVHEEINEMLRERLGSVPDNWLINYAHAVQDNRGRPRSADFRYIAEVAVLSVMASIRWNGSPSLSLMRTLASFLCHRSPTFPASSIHQGPRHA